MLTINRREVTTDFDSIPHVCQQDIYICMSATTVGMYTTSLLARPRIAYRSLAAAHMTTLNFLPSDLGHN